MTPQQQELLRKQTEIYTYFELIIDDPATRVEAINKLNELCDHERQLTFMEAEKRHERLQDDFHNRIILEARQ
jgi:hypothetical protein